MSRYCAICGRELKISNGPIGPVCIKKYAIGFCRIPREIELEYLRKHDIFGDIHEQTEDAQAGTSVKTKKDG